MSENEFSELSIDEKHIIYDVWKANVTARKNAGLSLIWFGQNYRPEEDNRNSLQVAWPSGGLATVFMQTDKQTFTAKVAAARAYGTYLFNQLMQLVEELEPKA